MYAYHIRDYSMAEGTISYRPDMFHVQSTNYRDDYKNAIPDHTKSTRTYDINQAMLWNVEAAVTKALFQCLGPSQVHNGEPTANLKQ